MSPTYQVTCTQCGKEKWATAMIRPLDYVCVLCVSIGPVAGKRRKEQGNRLARWKKAQPRGSQGPQETPG